MSPSPDVSLIAVAAGHHEISGLVFAFCLSATPNECLDLPFRRFQWGGLAWAFGKDWQIRRNQEAGEPG